ncbi:MAG: hypothetical protein NUV80_06540 [Candidatus Berkelbacteria bacterium]|nr:hypothetical protein [Candidatus Berkelbacteria bacterium]
MTTVCGGLPTEGSYFCFTIREEILNCCGLVSIEDIEIGLNGETLFREAFKLYHETYDDKCWICTLVNLHYIKIFKTLGFKTVRKFTNPASGNIVHIMCLLPEIE